MPNELDFAIKIETNTQDSAQKIDELQGSFGQLNQNIQQLISTNETYRNSVNQLNEVLNQTRNTFISNFFLELGFQLDKQILAFDGFNGKINLFVTGIDLLSGAVKNTAQSFSDTIGIINPFGTAIDTTISSVKNLAVAVDGLQGSAGKAFSAITDSSISLPERFLRIGGAISDVRSSVDLLQTTALNSLGQIAASGQQLDGALDPAISNFNALEQVALRSGNAVWVYTNAASQALRGAGVDIDRLNAGINSGVSAATQSFDQLANAVNSNFNGINQSVGGELGQVEATVRSTAASAVESLGQIGQGAVAASGSINQIGVGALTDFSANVETARNSFQGFADNISSLNSRAIGELGLTTDQTRQLTTVFTALSGNTTAALGDIAQGSDLAGNALDRFSQSIQQSNGDLLSAGVAAIEFGRDIQQSVDTGLRSFNAAVEENSQSFSNFLDSLNFNVTPGLFSDLALSIGEINGGFEAINEGVAETQQVLQNFAGVSIPGLNNFREEAFKAFAEFDTARAKVSTLSGDSVRFGENIKVVAKELGNQFTATELLNNSYDVLSAGFADTSSALEVVRGAAILSKAGFTDNRVAVDALTSILNAYNLSADQTESVTDQLIQTQNLGKLTVAEYGASIGQVVTIAAQAGVKLDELNAFIATATLKGLGASEAITGLRQAIASVLNPSSEAVNLARELGIEFDATALKTKGLSGILSELNARGLDTPEVLNKLFGSVEAVGAILPSLGDGISTFEANLNSLKSTAGLAEAAFASVTETSTSRAQAFGNRVKDAFLGVGEEIQKLVDRTTTIGNAFLSVFESINPTGQIAILSTAYNGVANSLGGIISASATTVLGLAALYAAWQTATFVAQGFATAAQTGSIALELLSERSEIYQAALGAINFAGQIQGNLLGFLSGQTKELAFNLDLAQAKTFLFAGANKVLEGGVAIANAAILAQTTLISKGVGFALDGFNSILAYANVQLQAAKSISLVTVAQDSFNTAFTYLDDIGAIKIFQEGIAFSVNEVKKFGINLISLAGNLTNYVAAQLQYIGALDIGAKAQSAWTATLAGGENILKLAGAQISAFRAVITATALEMQAVSLSTTGLSGGLSVLKTAFLGATTGAGTASAAIVGFGVSILTVAGYAAAAVLTFETLRFAFDATFNNRNESVESTENAFAKLNNTLSATPIEKNRNAFQLLTAGTEQTNNILEKTAISVSNLLNGFQSGALASDRFGEQIRLITDKQQKAQASVIALSDELTRFGFTSKIINNLIGEFGLLTLEAGDRTRLGAEGIKEFTTRAERQIAISNEQLKVLREIIPIDEEQRKGIADQINIKEQEIEQLQRRIAFLKSGADVEIKALDQVKTAYESQTQSLEAELAKQKNAVLEKQSAGIVGEQQAQAEIAAIELEGIKNRITQSATALEALRANLIGLDPNKDGEKIKEINQEIARIEGEGIMARTEANQAAINARQKAEEDGLNAIVNANKAAADALKQSIESQIAGIKALGLSREEEAKRIATIELAGANDRVAATQKEISDIKLALSQGTIDREEANKKLIALNGDLAMANAQRIDETIQAEEALVASIVAIGEQKIKQAVDAEKTAQAEIATLLNEGVITKEEAEKRILEASSNRFQAEFDAAKSNLDRLLALPSPSDPVAERERTEEIANARRDLTDKTIALQNSIADKDQEILNAKLNAYDLEDQKLSAQVESLQRQGELREAQVNLQSAISDAAVSRSELEITKLEEALEIRKRLDTDANLSSEQRLVLQNRLNELGVSGGASEKQIRDQIFAKEQELVGLKRQAFEAQQAADRAELESKLEIQKFELESLKIARDKAIATAQDERASAKQIEAAEFLKSSYDQAALNYEKISTAARATLATQQDSAKAAFEAKAQGDLYAASLDKAASNVIKVSEGLVSVRTNQQIAAEQAERQAQALARTAANAQRLKEAGDQITSSFVAATDQLENLRQGFVALTVQDAFTGQIEQALNVNIKIADTLELRKEELAILQEQSRITQQIQQLAVEGDKLALEAALIEQRSIDQRLANIQEEIRYNNELVELKKQQDAIQSTINASGGIATNQSERLRSLAEDLVDLSQRRQKELTTEAFANQNNANFQSLAVQNLTGQVNQLVSRYAQIPSQIGAAADGANTLASNTFNAVDGANSLASGFDAVTNSIDRANRAASNFSDAPSPRPSPRAKGGPVYEVNEQGQESYLNYTTGGVQLLPPGRRKVSFSDPGFVFTAPQTREMMASGTIGRAEGGIVLTQPVLTALTNAGFVVSSNEIPAINTARQNPTASSLSQAAVAIDAWVQRNPGNFNINFARGYATTIRSAIPQIASNSGTSGSLLGGSSSASSRSGTGNTSSLSGGFTNPAPSNSPVFQPNFLPAANTSSAPLSSGSSRGSSGTGVNTVASNSSSNGSSNSVGLPTFPQFQGFGFAPPFQSPRSIEGQPGSVDPRRLESSINTDPRRLENTVAGAFGGGAGASNFGRLPSGFTGTSGAIQRLPSGFTGNAGAIQPLPPGFTIVGGTVREIPTTIVPPATPTPPPPIVSTPITTPRSEPLVPSSVRAPEVLSRSEAGKTEKPFDPRSEFAGRNLEPGALEKIVKPKAIDPAIQAEKLLRQQESENKAKAAQQLIKDAQSLIESFATATGVDQQLRAQNQNPSGFIQQEADRLLRSGILTKVNDLITKGDFTNARSVAQTQLSNATSSFSSLLESYLIGLVETAENANKLKLNQSSNSIVFPTIEASSPLVDAITQYYKTRSPNDLKTAQDTAISLGQTFEYVDRTREQAIASIIDAMTEARSEATVIPINSSRSTNLQPPQSSSGQSAQARSTNLQPPQSSSGQSAQATFSSTASDPNQRAIRTFASGGTFSSTSSLNSASSTISPNFLPNASNSFIAGERGAELITLDGNGGARIFNNAETRQMLANYQPKLPGFERGGGFDFRAPKMGGESEIVRELREIKKKINLERPNVTVATMDDAAVANRIMQESLRREVAMGGRF